MVQCPKVVTVSGRAERLLHVLVRHVRAERVKLENVTNLKAHMEKRDSKKQQRERDTENGSISFHEKEAALANGLDFK